MFRIFKKLCFCFKNLTQNGLKLAVRVSKIVTDIKKCYTTQKSIPKNTLHLIKYMLCRHIHNLFEVVSIRTCLKIFIKQKK